MGSLMQRVKEKGLTRRTFIQGSALAAAALALQGCSNSNLQTTTETDPVTEGEWKSVACWAHCGGRCALKAYMVDGICIRLKTDDTHEDSPENPLRKACARGRSRRMDVFGPTRLRYPMKRKNWQPGGGENSQGHLRGIDEWERITWEEALDLVAEETMRIIDTYGNSALLSSSRGDGPRAWSEESRMDVEDYSFGETLDGMLYLIGGCTTNYSTMSQGAWYTSGLLYGYDFWKTGNDRIDARNCEYVVAVGINPAVTAEGQVMYSTLYPIQEAGAKFYFIDPMFTDTAAGIGGEWVPIRPATDKALLLAMAYVMFAEDDPATNPMIDWEFLEKCAIGYDADHMPEGEDPAGNFKDYALGTYDGVPKTPEWASEITGVPAEKIWELGRVMSKENKVALCTGLGPARNNNAEILTQMHITLGAMGGHMGKSGHMTQCAMDAIPLNDGGPWITKGPSPIPMHKNPVEECIPSHELWNAVLTGSYNYSGYREFLPREERTVDIKMFYSYCNDILDRTEDASKGIEALRKLEFVVAHGYTFNDNALHADIVLPCVSAWERTPFFTMSYRISDWCILSQPLSEPLYEAKNEQWIAAQLLERWGVDAKEIYPVDELGQQFSVMYGAEVIKENGVDYEPLLSFTAEEAALFGPDAEPREEGRFSYTEFAEMGIYNIERKPGDKLSFIGFKDFCDNPEANPLPSESGKLEIYSKAAVRVSASMQYSDIAPIPKYEPTLNGYESTFSDYASKTKGEYPYQLYTPHYPRSLHASLDWIPWLREAFARPVYIATQDAQAKGIADGDTVRIFNAQGSTLRPACVTDRIMPGVVALPHGGEVEIDEKTGFSKHGNENWLGAPVATGCGIDGYNSQICNFEKYAGEQLLPDCELPNRNPALQLED